MVWKTIKKKYNLEEKSAPSNDRPKSCGNACCKCSDKCKKCGSECQCSTKKIYIRAPLFTYYTDLMH